MRWLSTCPMTALVLVPRSSSTPWSFPGNRQHNSPVSDICRCFAAGAAVGMGRLAGHVQRNAVQDGVLKIQPELVDREHAPSVPLLVPSVRSPFRAATARAALVSRGQVAAAEEERRDGNVGHDRGMRPDAEETRDAAGLGFLLLVRIRIQEDRVPVLQAPKAAMKSGPSPACVFGAGWLYSLTMCGLPATRWKANRVTVAPSG